MTDKVLIIGATGKVGGELAKLLMRSGKSVRAATRRPLDLKESLPAPSEVVEFDFEKPPTFAPALVGITQVFLIARPGDNHSDEAAAPFIDKAKEARVRHIVNLTAMGVETDETFMLRVLERHVENTGIPYTHLRPNWFMQNFSSGPMHAEINATGMLHLPAADAKLSFIDIRDIAAVAFEALVNPRHERKAYTLTGNEALDHFEAMEKISRVSRKTYTYVPIDEEVARAGLARNGFPPDLIERWTDFYRKIRHGLCSTISPDVETILGRRPISFDQYAAEYAAAW